MKKETLHRDTPSQILAAAEIYTVSDCKWCADRSDRNFTGAGARMDFVVPTGSQRRPRTAPAPAASEEAQHERR